MSLVYENSGLQLAENLHTTRLWDRNFVITYLKIFDFHTISNFNFLHGFSPTRFVAKHWLRLLQRECFSMSNFEKIKYYVCMYWYNFVDKMHSVIVAYIFFLQMKAGGRVQFQFPMGKAWTGHFSPVFGTSVLIVTITRAGVIVCHFWWSLYRGLINVAGDRRTTFWIAQVSLAFSALCVFQFFLSMFYASRSLAKTS